MNTILLSFAFLIVFVIGYVASILTFSIYKKYEKNILNEFIDNFEKKLKDKDVKLNQILDALKNTNTENAEINNISKNVRDEWFYGTGGNE